MPTTCLANQSQPLEMSRVLPPISKYFPGVLLSFFFFFFPFLFSFSLI